MFLTFDFWFLASGFGYIREISAFSDVQTFIVTKTLFKKPKKCKFKFVNISPLSSSFPKAYGVK